MGYPPLAGAWGRKNAHYCLRKVSRDRRYLLLPRFCHGTAHLGTDSDLLCRLPPGPAYRVWQRNALAPQGAPNGNPIALFIPGWRYGHPIDTRVNDPLPRMFSPHLLLDEGCVCLHGYRSRGRHSQQVLGRCLPRCSLDPRATSSTAVVA